MTAEPPRTVAVTYDDRTFVVGQTWRPRQANHKPRKIMRIITDRRGCRWIVFQTRAGYLDRQAAPWFARWAGELDRQESVDG